MPHLLAVLLKEPATKKRENRAVRSWCSPLMTEGRRACGEAGRGRQSVRLGCGQPCACRVLGAAASDEAEVS